MYVTQYNHGYRLSICLAFYSVWDTVDYKKNSITAVKTSELQEPRVKNQIVKRNFLKWAGSLFLFFAKKYSVSFCFLTKDLNVAILGRLLLNLQV